MPLANWNAQSLDVATGFQQHSGGLAKHTPAAEVFAAGIAVPLAYSALLEEDFLHLTTEQNQRFGGLRVAVDRQHRPRQQSVQHPLGIVLRQGLP